MGWIYVGVPAVVLSLASISTLIVAWRILRTVRRSEQAGDERLEILREQQQRLDYLYEERRQLLQALEVQCREQDEQRRRLELPSAPATAREGRESRETPAEDAEGTEHRPATGGAEERPQSVARGGEGSSGGRRRYRRARHRRARQRRTFAIPSFVVLLVCLAVLVAVALAFEWPAFLVPVLSPD
jgi:hypothetical protein